MAETRKRWRPTPTTLVAGGLVLAGFLLANVSWWFLALVGVGALGPGILRELGWLRDKDEFQLAATRRAAYHGFLAAGLVAFALVPYFRVHREADVRAGDVVELLLAVLWFTALLSSLVSYWGARRMAVRVLWIFGGVWLLFVVLSHTGDGWQGVVGLLMSGLVVLPFFALAWAAPRWPRVAGLLLLACGAFAVYFFDLHQLVLDPFANGGVMVLIFFVGPLVIAGLGLLQRGDDGPADPA